MKSRLCLLLLPALINAQVVTQSAPVCRAIGAWAGNSVVDTWCNNNCNHTPSFCPAFLCICPATPTPGCPQRRVRKNVRSLSSTEISKLQTAMRTAIASSTQWQRFQDVAHFHGEPNTGDDALCPNATMSMCCPHWNSQFLPWHRLLMANMEELLGEPLPYWDWTEDNDVPQIFESISVPLKNIVSGAQNCRGTNTSIHRRGRNINIQADILNSTVGLAFEEVTYGGFWDRIGSPHDTLHISMGCDMDSVEAAAYDPVFYLHHANVDRQFAFWQELQRIRRADIDDSDLRTPLQPFDNETVNRYPKTRRNSLGVDTLDYRNNLCYEYDTLTFDGKTPEQYLRGTRKSAKLTPSFRYFVGVILPKICPSSIVQFNVCSPGGACQAGGSVCTFGLRPGTASGGSKPVNSNNYHISEYEVTDLDVEDWDTAFARVTSSQDVSPVAPVIIKRPVRARAPLEGGTVLLAPGTNRGMYGDLLDNFE